MRLQLASRYEAFHADVFSGLAEPLLQPALEERPELELQSLWFAGEFGSEFRSTDNRRVLVRDWGVWNSGAGPDFKGCTIQIDNEMLSGDIELDPDARDWERHQHGGNPDYDRVILHLFVSEGTGARFFTRTSQHREVAQVLLKQEHLQGGLARPSRQAAARVGRCAVPLGDMNPSSVASLLESAAQYRMQRKSRRLHQWVAAHGREQTVYQALAQALGYRANALPFIMLAQRLPLKTLLALEESEREAMLFGVSGFLESVVYDQTRADTRGYLRGLWENWWKMRVDFPRWTETAQLLKWRAVGTRPGNHPQRRLGALTALLRQWSAVMKPLKQPEQWNAKTWTSLLSGLRHDYWDTHYTLLAEPASRPIALLGKTRVQEMLANVVYPLLVPEKPALWQEYLELPALLDNEKVSLACIRLFGTSNLANNFRKKLHHQQGLLQLYEDFCLEDDSNCADCPFPERLKQWQ